jgi:nucleoside-diphosphate-sugar epimerase
MTNLIFGCGYLGMRVARRWIEQGIDVAAVTRRSDRAETLAKEGVRPIVADVTRGETLADLPEAAVVLVAVGHDRSSGQSIEATYVEGLRNILGCLNDRTKRIVYVSSTGIFGPAAGATIDETTAPNPTTTGGRAHWLAEQTLAEHRLGERAIVLRMAGLYGPGRLPRLADLVAGRPIAASPDGQVNLIHIDDGASAAVAAGLHRSAPELFLISDGHPVARREFLAEMARIAGASPPKFVDAARLDPAARGSGDKRIDNRRMIERLGVEIEYPTYREGLAASYGR